MGPPLVEVVSGQVVEEKEKECDDMSGVYNKFKDGPRSPLPQTQHHHPFEPDEGNGVLVDSASQADIDERYEMMEAIVGALSELSIPHCIMAGTLLGAVRSHSLLFHDHSLNMAIIDVNDDAYNHLAQDLAALIQHHHCKGSSSASCFDTFTDDPSSSLSDDHKAAKYQFQYRPWAASDRLIYAADPNISVEIFHLRQYSNREELVSTLSNDTAADRTFLSRDQDIPRLVQIMESQRSFQYPIYHHSRVKAIQSRPNEYFIPQDLLPIQATFTFGPLNNLSGPNNPLTILSRTFGPDCFTHYTKLPQRHIKLPIHEAFYLPLQHSTRKQLGPTHCKLTLEKYLQQQNQKENTNITLLPTISTNSTPQHTILKQTPHLTRTKSMQIAVTLVEEQLTSLQRNKYDSMNLNNLSISISQSSSNPSSLQNFANSSFATMIQMHTSSSPDTPNFNDKSLRQLMEPHIRKARAQRESCRQQLIQRMAIKSSACIAANNSSSIVVANDLTIPYPILRNERPFIFDIDTYPLHKIFANALNVNDLSLLHNHTIKDKKQLLQGLLTETIRRPFHECYDNFVTSFCIPLLHSIAMRENVLNSNDIMSSRHPQTICYRYQAFPSISIIRPGESSLGPHCDMSYGHSPGNINFHVPLTPVYGTNSLFTESHPKRENWHPLTAKSVGLGYVLDGSRCLHFTLENTTRHTRVSLDFRIAISRKIVNGSHTRRRGDLISNLHLEDEEDDMKDTGLLCGKEILKDRFSTIPGFYDEAYIDVGNMERRQFAPGPVYKKISSNGKPRLLYPDKQEGFPFM